MIVKAESVFIVFFLLDFVTECKNTKDSCQDIKWLFGLNEIKSEVDYTKLDSSVNRIISVNNVTALDHKSNGSSVNLNSSTVAISCFINRTYEYVPVEILNATKLAMLLHVEPNITHRQIPGKCVAVLFYSPSCPFSCMAAPHYNALPKFFPDIKMVAVDAVKYRGFNAQFGIVGTPTLMLFHGGRPAAKFNETSEYGLEIFANFITKHTGIQPLGKLVVTSADFKGPVSSNLVRETDYYLVLSWLVIMARITYSFYYSTWGRSLVDATLNAWREAEAQHHHID